MMSRKICGINMLLATHQPVLRLCHKIEAGPADLFIIQTVVGTGHKLSAQ